MNLRSKDDKQVDYDRISEIYDISRMGAYPETVEKLARYLSINPDSVLLDMGCGTGNYASVLQRVARSIIGIDLSKGMIRRARSRLLRWRSLRGDIIRLPFHSDVFDGAYAVQVIHHVKNKDAFLDEAYRVIREDGCIAIDSCSHEQLRIHWFYHYFPSGLEIDLARIPDTGEVISMLERAGFTEIGVDKCYSDMVVTQETPESYLDKAYRDGISTFSLLTSEEIEDGCEKIREEIASGAAYKVVQLSREVMARRLGGSSIIYGKR